MKKLFCFALILMGLGLTSCYKAEIEELQNRLEILEGTQIASLQGQIDAIRKSLPELEKTSMDLKAYIESLQKTASDLQKSIEAVNEQVESAKSALKAEEAARLELIQSLTSLKTELESELENINKTIASLKAKDADLETKIGNLRKYVDEELAANKDWANATFATLEQYSSLASGIAAIKAQIETLNKTTSDLEASINDKVAKDIAEAMSTLDTAIQNQINALTAAYTQAISAAKNEITAAYTSAIADAIAATESSMKAWVNELLKGYYTIAEVEGKLAALQSIVSENDKAMQAEIDAVVEALAETKSQIEEAYEKAIEDAIRQNGGVVDGKISVAIAEVNVRIENEIKAINASISAIETRLQKLEGDIATISEQVANINSTIENLQSTSEELDDYIESLQATAKTLQEMIEASDAEIDEVEARLKGETEDVRNEILRQLASLKANTEAELDRINGLIAALQVKDAELDGKITSLQSYVESELASNRDWVEATIATLEQYGSLASDIAAIKAQMQAVNERIDWLDNTLTNKINDQLSTILSVCSGEIQSSVTKVTEEYTQAIDKAKEDITAAYKAEIRNAFYALEASMKQWVNECLQQYYTISEVEGKLAALRAEFANADNEILDEIEALQKSYDASKQEMVGIIYNIVEQTIDTNNGIIDDRIDEAIVRITDNIQNQIDAIAEQIAQIESRLNTIESDLANVKGQIWAILDSIEKLEDTYDQLDGYVSHLSSVAGELQQSLGQIDSRIDEVETSLGGEISSAKAELKAQLNALRESIVSQLEQIGQTVEMLQAKEDQLAVRISDLQTYVDTELADNKDWANATFATLEHQNFLANEVASIKAQIDAINQGMTALYARMEEKINDEISAVTASLSSTIQSKVDDVTSAYSAAILTAKEQITAAYTAEIQNAFYALESSLMGWVSQQLSGYYTISQVESLLASMSNEFNNKLDSQKAYLEGLISSLSTEVKDQIQDNRTLIYSLSDNIDNLKELNISDHIYRISENAGAIADNAQSIMDNAAAISANSSDIQSNVNLIEANKFAIEANARMAKENKAALEQLTYNAEAAIAKNATDVARNAEDIARNAALIAQNAAAISNNSQAVANNAADIWQLQQDLQKTKDEITQAYKDAIDAAIAQNGSMGGDVAAQISAVNSRIDSEVDAINDAIAALKGRVETLESEVDAIQQQMMDIISEISDMKQNISDLMKRVQSITYIPKYSDGKATVVDGSVELDFKISPLSAVADIAQNWESILSIKAVNTITRSVSFIDMPIISFEADQTNGVVSLVASAAGLPDEFHNGLQTASAALSLSDGNNEIISDFIPMAPFHPYNEIWYTSTDGTPVAPNAVDVFGAKIISNNYAGSRGVLKFDGPVTSVGVSAFENCSTLATIELPGKVAEIGGDAFDNCKSLVSISIPASVTSIASLGFLAKFEAMYIQDLSAWCAIDFNTTIFSAGDKLYVNGEELTELVIPSDVTEVKQYAFGNLTNLTKVTIPDHVVSIGQGVFYNCSNLTEVTIGKGVTSMSANVFVYCSKLSTVYCRATIPPSLYYSVGSGAESCVFPKNSGMKIYVPESSYSTYTRYTSYKSGESSPQNWYVYKSYIVSYDYGFEPEPAPVLEGNRIFYTTTDGNPITLYRPEAINSVILSNTYEDGVGVITCTEDITEIGYYAFRSCDNLQTVTLPSTVTRYGQYVVYSCSNLKEIYITSTTPPEIYYQYYQIGSFPFSSSVKIYVPREAYDVYTQYTGYGEQSYLQMNWSQHKSQLQPYDY